MDKYRIMLLFILFFYQGLLLGFIEGAIPIMLIQNGASWNQIGLLSFAAYPWSFKFLTAPIMDTYYSPSFGQRKTYLTPL